MSDAEALEELAVSRYYLWQARKQAESEEVVHVLDESLEFLDQRLNDVVAEIGRQEYDG